MPTTLTADVCGEVGFFERVRFVGFAALGAASVVSGGSTRPRSRFVSKP